MKPDRHGDSSLGGETSLAGDGLLLGKAAHDVELLFGGLGCTAAEALSVGADDMAHRHGGEQKKMLDTHCEGMN